MLSWLDVVQVNRGLRDASGNGRDRCKQAPTTHFNTNRIVGKGVVNQIQIADAKRHL